jgi:hypothetical protein
MVIGLPHSEIYGCSTYLQFPIAYRSLSRPSSSLEAKASPVYSYKLFSFNSFNTFISYYVNELFNIVNYTNVVLPIF